MPFAELRNVLDVDNRKVFDEGTDSSFEELLRQLPVFVTALSLRDESLLELPKGEVSRIDEIRAFIRRIMEYETPWAHSPNYLLTRSLLRLRYHHYDQISFEEPSLDFGSGDGRTTFLAFDHNFSVGVDLTFDDVKQSKTYGKHKQVACADARQLPLPDGQFKTVMSNHTLYHVANKRKALEEIFRVMAPGGSFYFDDITARMYSFEDRSFLKLLEGLGSGNLAAGYKKYFHALYEQNNKWDAPIKPDEMKALLMDVGFVDVEYEYFMAPETAQLGWFVYDLVGCLQREFYFYFSEGMETQYHEFVFERLAKLIDTDRYRCQKWKDGNYVFYKMRKP